MNISLTVLVCVLVISALFASYQVGGENPFDRIGLFQFLFTLLRSRWKKKNWSQMPWKWRFRVYKRSMFVFFRSKRVQINCIPMGCVVFIDKTKQSIAIKPKNCSPNFPFHANTLPVYLIYRLLFHIRVEKKCARTQAHRHQQSGEIQLIKKPLNFHLVRLSPERNISLFAAHWWHHFVKYAKWPQSLKP